MTAKSTILGIASAVVAVAMTAACSNSAERKTDAAANDAGNAASRAGGAVAGAATDAARATGDAVMNGGRAADAAVETMDVKMALTADSRVDASDINVDTNHLTKTVTLKGSVPTAAQKTLVEEVAKAKATGYAVNNLLTVGR